MIYLLFSLLAGIFLFFLAAVVTSLSEREWRAALILSAAMFILPGSLYILYESLSAPLDLIIALSIPGTILILFFIPTKRLKYNFEFPENFQQFHEADAVLSRRRLEPESKRYAEYYQARPELQEIDDKSRGNPGLLSANAAYYDPLTFKAAEAGFILTDHLHDLADQIKTGSKEKLDPRNTSKFIQYWLKKNGAHSIGFTRLKAHHLYLFETNLHLLRILVY